MTMELSQVPSIYEISTTVKSLKGAYIIPFLLSEVTEFSEGKFSTINSA